MFASQRVGVVADDLTGGASIAGELVREGWPCAVIKTGRPIPSTGSVVVETGSRFDHPDAAAGAVRDAVEALGDAGLMLTLKKIDSSLKGNAVAEIVAYINAVGRGVVVAPACPTAATTVRGGVVWQRGDRGTDVVAALQEATAKPVGWLDLEVVRQGTSAVEDWFRKHAWGVTVADAETQDDLDTVCSGARRAGAESFAGTYGLGAALARASKPVKRSPFSPEFGAKRVIVLVGSASERAQKQVEQLAAHGALDIPLDVHALLDGNEQREALRVRKAVKGSDLDVVVVHTATASTRGGVTERRDGRGLTERELARVFAGPMVAAVRAAPGAALVLVGGETTGAITELLGIENLTVLAELLPASPLCRAGTGELTTIVTKPGSFGEVSALVQLSCALRS